MPGCTPFLARLFAVAPGRRVEKEKEGVQGLCWELRGRGFVVPANMERYGNICADMRESRIIQRSSQVSEKKNRTQHNTSTAELVPKTSRNCPQKTERGLVLVRVQRAPRNNRIDSPPNITLDFPTSCAWTNAERAPHGIRHHSFGAVARVHTGHSIPTIELRTKHS